MDKHLSDRLKELREKNKWTKVYVADKLGITPQAYGNYEYGIREPSNKLLTELANIFGVSTDYLLTGKAETKTIDLKKADVLSYDGKPISDEELEIIKAILNRHGINK